MKGNHHIRNCVRPARCFRNNIFTFRRKLFFCKERIGSPFFKEIFSNFLAKKRILLVFDSWYFRDLKFLPVDCDRSDFDTRQGEIAWFFWQEKSLYRLSSEYLEKDSFSVRFSSQKVMPESIDSKTFIFVDIGIACIFCEWLCQGVRSKSARHAENGLHAWYSHPLSKLPWARFPETGVKTFFVRLSVWRMLKSSIVWARTPAFKQLPGFFSRRRQKRFFPFIKKKHAWFFFIPLRGSYGYR